MSSNKAQTQQIFVYILTIAIIAMIFIFGYKATIYFLDKGEEVSYIKFKTDLSDTVRIMGPKYGSVDRKEFIVGGDFTEVCFVDGIGVSSAGHPVMEQLVDSGIKENMFLFIGESPEKEYIGKIEVGDAANTDFLCIKLKQGRLRLQFEGLGDKTLITEWPYS